MKKRMLLFHQCGAFGGASVSLLHIIESIDQEKFDVWVACPKEPDDMINKLREYNVNIIVMEKPPAQFAHYNGGIHYALSLRTWVNLYQIWRDKARIQCIIRDNNPDIVVVNSMTLFMIGKYAKKYNKKTICFHRETYQKGLFGFRSWIIKRELSKNFDKIVFISKYDSEQTGKSKAQKYIIYDKVDMSLYQGEKRKDSLFNVNDKVILYLGGMAKLKGGHIVLNAMNYIRTPDVKLLFIANTNETALASPMTFSNKILAKLKLSSYAMIQQAYQDVADCHKVVFQNTTDHPEKYFSYADLVVFPSTVAHQARPVYEAGSARRLIILSDYIETKEFAQDGVNVITFTPKDSMDLANRIDEFFADPLKYENVIQKNYEWTCHYHNLKDLKQELEKVFEGL